MDDHLDRNVRLALASAAKSQRLFWKDLRLERGDWLILQTKNTRYRLLVEHAGPRRCLVTSDGEAIMTPTRMTYVGSNPSFGSSMVMVGALAINLPCELSYLKDAEVMMADGGPVPLYLTTLQSVSLIKADSDVEIPLLPVLTQA